MGQWTWEDGAVCRSLVLPTDSPNQHEADKSCAEWFVSGDVARYQRVSGTGPRGRVFEIVRP